MGVNTIGVMRNDGGFSLMGATDSDGEGGVVVFEALPDAVQAVFDAAEMVAGSVPDGEMGVLQLDVPSFCELAQQTGMENVILHDEGKRLGESPVTLSLFTYALTSND